MDRDIAELLRSVEAAGLKAFGRNYAIRCPRCQHTRARHKHAKPLNIKRTSEGTLYNCWHCGWKGFLPTNDRLKSGTRAPGARMKRRSGLKLPAWV
jgi:hypothetical protein